MHHFIHRRGVLRTGLALGATLLLPTARACEFFTSTLRVTHPWVRASAAGATSAIVSMKFDEVIQADRLIRVETPVAAAAEMGGVAARPGVDYFIPQGQESALSETGTYLRLLGLKHPLEVGREYPLILVFEKGGVVEASLSVDFDSPA